MRKFGFWKSLYFDLDVGYKEVYTNTHTLIEVQVYIFNSLDLSSVSF